MGKANDIVAAVLAEPGVSLERVLRLEPLISVMKKPPSNLFNFLLKHSAELLKYAVDSGPLSRAALDVVTVNLYVFTKQLIRDVGFLTALRAYITQPDITSVGATAFVAIIMKFCDTANVEILIGEGPFPGPTDTFLASLVTHHAHHGAVRHLLQALSRDSRKAVVTWFENSYAAELFLRWGVREAGVEERHRRLFLDCLASAILNAEADTPMLSPFEDSATIDLLLRECLEVEHRPATVAAAFRLLTVLTGVCAQQENDPADPLHASVAVIEEAAPTIIRMATGSLVFTVAHAAAARLVIALRNAERTGTLAVALMSLLQKVPGHSFIGACLYEALASLGAGGAAELLQQTQALVWMGREPGLVGRALQLVELTGLPLELLTTMPAAVQEMARMRQICSTPYGGEVESKTEESFPCGRSGRTGAASPPSRDLAKRLPGTPPILGELD